MDSLEDTNIDMTTSSSVSISHVASGMYAILHHPQQTWTLLKADERRLEALHINCQRPILGIRWFHFVTNAPVTSQTGEEGLAIWICRRRLPFLVT